MAQTRIERVTFPYAESQFRYSETEILQWDVTPNYTIGPIYISAEL
jgi:hypothetical protein